jgi:hypothetical protein
MVDLGWQTLFIYLVGKKFGLKRVFQGGSIITGMYASS